MLLGIAESFGGHGREAWSQSRKEAGYHGDSNPGPEAWACHHQCLLLFSAHVLTDKGEKQNLRAAMSRGQEKKHLRRFQALPGSLLPALTPKGSRGLQSPCLPVHVSHPHEKSMKSDPEGEPCALRQQELCFAGVDISRKILCHLRAASVWWGRVGEETGILPLLYTFHTSYFMSITHN